MTGGGLGQVHLRGLHPTSLHLSPLSPADAPDRVLLKLQPTWVTVGRTFTIECTVPAVSPLEKLTLTLLRGKEPLHIQTFGKATTVPQEAVATHNVTAHREDGHHNFSCQAELDLRSLGGTVLRKVSEPQVLKIYGEGEPPGQREGGGRHSLLTLSPLSASSGARHPGPHTKSSGLPLLLPVPRSLSKSPAWTWMSCWPFMSCVTLTTSAFSLWPWLLSTMRSLT